jgi:xanthosine utilization system XapX-like protein
MSEGKNHRWGLPLLVGLLGILVGSVAVPMVRDRILTGERGAATSTEVVNLKERVVRLEADAPAHVGVKEFGQFEKRVDAQFAEVKAQLIELKRLIERQRRP